MTAGREQNRLGEEAVEQSPWQDRSCAGPKAQGTFSDALGEGGQWWLLQTRLGWGGTTKSNVEKNQCRCLSSEREKMDLVVIGHVLPILGEGGDLNPPYFKLWRPWQSLLCSLLPRLGTEPGQEGPCGWRKEN